MLFATLFGIIFGCKADLEMKYAASLDVNEFSTRYSIIWKYLSDNLSLNSGDKEIQSNLYPVLTLLAKCEYLFSFDYYLTTSAKAAAEDRSYRRC
jgi:hypothetical protein